MTVVECLQHADSPPFRRFAMHALRILTSLYCVYVLLAHSSDGSFVHSAFLSLLFLKRGIVTAVVILSVKMTLICCFKRPINTPFPFSSFKNRISSFWKGEQKSWCFSMINGQSSPVFIEAVLFFICSTDYGGQSSLNRACTSVQHV